MNLLDVNEGWVRTENEVPCRVGRGEPSLEGYHVSLTESNTDAFRHL
jgi:hypothetical protein|eukprot:SAG25_NODE_1158_length_3743_cov_2.497256_3_plen_47_part_00